MRSMYLAAAAATTAVPLLLIAWGGSDLPGLGPRRLGADPSSTKKGMINCAQINSDWWNRSLPEGDPLFVYPYNECPSGLSGYDCISCSTKATLELRDDNVVGGYIQTGSSPCNDIPPSSSYAGTCHNGACLYPNSYSCPRDAPQYGNQSQPGNGNGG